MVGGSVAVALGLIDMATMGDHRALLPHVLALVHCRADGRSTLVTSSDRGARNPKPKAAPASDFAWRFGRFLVGEELLGSPE